MFLKDFCKGVILSSMFFTIFGRMEETLILEKEIEFFENDTITMKCDFSEIFQNSDEIDVVKVFAANFEWFFIKNGSVTPLLNNSNDKFVENSNLRNFYSISQIKNVNESDEGTYECRINIDDQSPYKIKYNTKFQKNKVTNITGIQGKPIQILCDFKKNKNEGQIFWELNEKILNIDEHPVDPNPTGRFLSSAINIKNLDKAKHEGEYNCIWKNSKGEKQTKIYFLKINLDNELDSNSSNKISASIKRISVTNAVILAVILIIFNNVM
ncbi:fasciclin-2-like [Condylostylus longicornis]|uniref:fasciclin-2-like n=1 Tax=Condylostylus longicornis TaxID=2530218 RepID=UPI00244DBDDF|nr:fasciclin-2-like [Condylostylus longicornis]XP_055382768.1 fasciclin-2-like [Condylostylus longicornis]